MKEEIQGVIGVIVVLGLLFLVARFFRQTYSPPEVEPQEVRTTGVSESQRASGSSIPGMNIGGGSGLALARPVGEMLPGFLCKSGQKLFEEVQLVSNRRQAEKNDIIVELNSWSFGDEMAYNFKGLPLLFGWGDAFVSLNVEVQVSGPEIEPFRLRESVTKGCHFGLMLSPAARLSRTMTEVTDLVAASVSEKLMVGIAKDPRVGLLAGVELN